MDVEFVNEGARVLAQSTALGSRIVRVCDTERETRRLACCLEARFVALVEAL